MNCKMRYGKPTGTPARLAVLLGIAFIGINARSQTPAATPSDSDNDSILLSPFVVTSESDNGYVSTSSTAGTRINTSLKDISASISVVTKGMMNDLGVFNSQQLLTYTLGTEVSGPYGSFSGASTTPGTLAQDGVDRSFLPNERIRGLASADNTRDYFLTSIPWDGFNTDRVEINRGPNAMLFGSGSPSGIVNQSTIAPILGQNRTEATFNYGEFGSTRAQIDNNTVLIKDKLAIRVAAKYSDDRFMQDEAYIRDKRGFASVSYKPFSLTTIRANYEQGRQESVKPEWRPPFDDGVTAWFNLGKPAFDPTTGNTTLTGTWNQNVAPVGAVNSDGSTNHGIIQGNFNGYGWGSDNPGLVFTQPNQTGIVGSSLYTNAFSGGLSGLQVITNRGPGDISLGGLPASREYQIAEHQGQVGANNYNEQEINNPNIFDFYDHLLEGENKPEGAMWHQASISLEQLLPDHNGGIELVYNRESVHSSFNNPFNWETYGIGVDINSKLLDGSANPNFGRPVIASDSWSTEMLEKRDNKRATAFYTFALKKSGAEWLRNLIGSHTVTANYSDSSYSTVTNGGRGIEAGPDWVLENPNIATHLWSSNPQYTIDNGAARGFQSIVYLGNATSGNSPTGMNIQPITANVLIPGVTAVPAMFYDPNKKAWVQSGVTIVPASEFDKSNIDLNWTGGEVKSQTKSKVAILHSDILWNTLVPTIGYREDSLKFWNAPTDVFLPGNFSEAKAPLPSEPTSTETEHAFNWGAVARLPHSIQAKMPWDLEPSIFYNKSDNFSPTGQRVDIFGNPIAPTKGQTKEFGFMLSRFGDKVALRFTHFETSLTGVTQDRRDAFHTLLRNGAAVALADIQSGHSANLAGNATAASAFMDWYNSDPLAQQLRKTYTDSFNVVLDGIMLQTTDSVSKGDEIELTVNPTKNWRIAANFSNQSVVNENSSADAFKLLNEIEPVLKGPAGQVWVNGDTHQTWQSEAQTFVNTIDSDVALDGQVANPELRKNHLNVLTNYSFDTGFLKGFGIGGAMRWSSKILIGTGYVYSADLGRDVPDFSTQYWGPSETIFDGWISYSRPKIFRNVDWSIQLNVRNIGVGKKLIPVVAQPDGTIAQWRIAEPMTWSLSTKFDF